jgi:4,5-dihydroxyphthalate decarboxylase
LRKLPLTLAFSDYDHTRDLITGRVEPEGIELTCLTHSIEEIFHRFTVYREWDVSEMSMGKYVSLLSQGDNSMTAIPVFPSRTFRHSSIYVRRDGPVRAPADLKGKRVGLPEWAQTAAIYTRGFLMHQFGLTLPDVEWVQAGVNQPGRQEKVELRLPPGVRYRAAPEKTLNDMLLAGEVDAIMTAHAPAAFKSGDPRIVRLFENYVEVETEYYKATKIFPIMHVVALRREAVDANPWICMNLLAAFEEAKRRSIARALEITAPRFPIPWVSVHAERAQALFGADYWPYGVDANRTTLAAFLDFAHEQGVCHRRVAIEELFPASVGSRFKV